MSIKDMTIANADGMPVRIDLEESLQALASNSTFATEPTTRYKCQYWADTTGNRLRRRSAMNNSWIDIEPLDGVYPANTIRGRKENTPGFIQDLTIDQTKVMLDINVPATVSVAGVVEIATDLEAVLDGEAETIPSVSQVSDMINSYTIPRSGYSGIQVFTSSGTWTKPTDVKFIEISVTGGGGGGSGTGGRGGASGTGYKMIDVAAINAVSVTVGSGGLGNAVFVAAGGGSTSIFGSNLSVSGGGGGGASGVQGSGGTSPGGDWNFEGGPGSAAGGGTSSYGWGSYGSGGNGPGANGGNGIVIVKEYK